MIMRVADYVMQKLYGHGIEHLFMVTGRGILYLSDAAAKQEGLTCVSTHHEQGASYAAMAYAQNNGIGACLVSTGCASANAVTAALCAWQDDVPMVVVSGQNTLRETVRHTSLPVRTYGQQEADIIDIVKPVTKYAVMLEDSNRAVYEVEKALYLAVSGRKGPVWIDVPLDVQNMRIDPDEQEHYVPEGNELPEASRIEVAEVVNALKEAKRPVLFIGSGIHSSGAKEDFAKFVEKYNFPVVYSAGATDVYGSKNDLAIGTVGAMGASRAANFTVQNSDLLLVVGCRMTSMTVGIDACKFAREAKVVAVDIDPHEHKKGTVNIDKVIISDAKKFINLLANEEIKSAPKEWLDKCLHWKKIFPKCEEERKQSTEVDMYYLADRLSKHLDDDAVFVSDSGLEELILPTNIDFGDKQRALHPSSQGAMGYALPATIGAYCASGKQVVTVIGDGSIMMNIQELQTISYNKFPIKIIVLNNNCYAVIRKRQKDLFRTRTVGTDAENGVSCPDFKKVAECFGFAYSKIENSTNLDEGLKVALATDGPVICEVMGLEDQNYLHSSYARNVNGKFVQRPIEDQSPYLDRELFLSEMIVEPIDQ